MDWFFAKEINRDFKDDSDDGEQGLEGDSNEEDEGGSDEDSDDIDEDIPDIGEEPGKAKQEVENPLFEESGESNDSDSNDSDDSDDDSDDDDKKGEKSKGFEGEDDLIATLKAAREKKVRESPADIRLDLLLNHGEVKFSYYFRY